MPGGSGPPAFGGRQSTSGRESERSIPTETRSITDGNGRTLDLEAGPRLPADLDALVEMYAGFDADQRAQGLPPVGADAVREWLTGLDEGFHVVARHEGRPVGHATLVPAGPGAFELAVFVRAAYQRAGIGTATLELLFEYGAANGVETVVLSVAHTNTAAVECYRALGFEVVRADAVALEMRLSLADGVDGDARGGEDARPARSA